MKRLNPDIERLHPNLLHFGYEVTSDADGKYNCAAWAMEDMAYWWEPYKEHGVFWPPELPLEDSLENYINAFATNGYTRTDNASPELWVEKIAIFRDAYGNFMHVARQLADGNWTSKLGIHEDIRHSKLAALEDNDYGYVGVIMKRRCSLLGIITRAFFMVRDLVLSSRVFSPTQFSALVSRRVSRRGSKCG